MYVTLQITLCIQFMHVLCIYKIYVDKVIVLSNKEVLNYNNLIFVAIFCLFLVMIDDIPSLVHSGFFSIQW